MMRTRHPLFRTFAATVAIAAIASAWTIWGNRHAAALLQAAGIGEGKNHYILTLAFAPEGFHVTRLQAIGRLIEVRGPEVFLMDVDPAALRTATTAYWVRGVRPWPGR
jgi:hypothetical protein